jgi:hypothetical protein
MSTNIDTDNKIKFVILMAKIINSAIKEDPTINMDNLADTYFANVKDEELFKTIYPVLYEDAKISLTE